MDQLPPLGTAISSVVGPTFKVFAPLLLANAAAIKSTRCKSFNYGPHPRQALDVYYPSKANDTNPILVFVHGGGLVRGARTLPDYADSLVHANVGHFFAEKFGLSTVIPDYRLVGQHGARFPSGGEDIGLVVKWIRENLIEGGQGRDLFLMGNSAGGVHIATWMYGEQFGMERKEVSGMAVAGGLRLRGVVWLSVPFHFQAADQNREEVLREYFGKKIEEDSPLGLLRAANRNEVLEQTENVRVLVLNGELDPEDEILEPKREFLEEWERVARGESRTFTSVQMMEGQNHISPPLSLGTGKEAEEAWGNQVGAWIEGIMS